MKNTMQTTKTAIDRNLAVIASYSSESKLVTVEYQYDSEKVNGKVAYIMRWKDNNIGIKCNESGIRGQIYFDRGESIKRMQNKGYEIKYLN